jgi:hypothetical protein
MLAAMCAALVAGGCARDSADNTLASATASASDANLPQGGETVKLDPADFTTNIDNPYWPMTPGSRWVYVETDTEGAKQDVVVTITDRTKKLANGIEARIVHDAVTEDGEAVEITDDYYAQDKAGNIWYLGEKTAEYENGKVASTHGSFEAGVDGAQGGIALPADPKAGMTYRQEYYKGEAEDEGRIVSLDEQAEVPFGHFTDVLMTRDANPLEPKNLEFKFYAKDVGPVLTISVSGGSDREDLVSFKAGDAQK